MITVPLLNLKPCSIPKSVMRASPSRHIMNSTLRRRGLTKNEPAVRSITDNTNSSAGVVYNPSPDSPFSALIGSTLPGSKFTICSSSWTSIYLDVNPPRKTLSEVGRLNYNNPNPRDRHEAHPRTQRWPLAVATESGSGKGEERMPISSGYAS